MFNSVWYWLNAISCMCTLAKRSLALANWACTSCLSLVKPAQELQPSQTPRLKQQPEEQTKKIQQTLQARLGQFLENSVIKPPFGIMSPDVTAIHPNRCTAHVTKYKYNMLQVKLSDFQTKAAIVDVAPASQTSSFQALDLMSGFGCRNMQWNDHETTAPSSLLPGWNRCEEMRTSRMVHKRYIWCNRVAASPCFSAFLLYSVATSGASGKTHSFLQLL